MNKSSCPVGRRGKRRAQTESQEKSVAFISCRILCHRRSFMSRKRHTVLPLKIYPALALHHPSSLAISLVFLKTTFIKKNEYMETSALVPATMRIRMGWKENVCNRIIYISTEMLRWIPRRMANSRQSMPLKKETLTES